MAIPIYTVLPYCDISIVPTTARPDIVIIQEKNTQSSGDWITEKKAVTTLHVTLPNLTRRTISHLLFNLSKISHLYGKEKCRLELNYPSYSNFFLTLSFKVFFCFDLANVFRHLPGTTSVIYVLFMDTPVSELYI